MLLFLTKLGHLFLDLLMLKHKFHSDGNLARYKARWVVCAYSQHLGIEFDETFSPVVKPATIDIVLSLAISQPWPVH